MEFSGPSELTERLSKYHFIWIPSNTASFHHLMSGIAPGSYFSFDISDKMGIDITKVGVKRNLELEEALDSNGTLLTSETSMQAWRHGDTSDSSKSFTRSKYKCSHCGQVVPQLSELYSHPMRATEYNERINSYISKMGGSLTQL